MLPKSVDTLRIDINSGKVRKSIAVCQSDNIQRTLNFQLVNSGKALDLSDLYYAEILISKANGYEADNGCVIDGDSIQYTLRSTDIAALGTNTAQLLLTFTDGEVLTTPTFEIVVYSKVLDQKNQTSLNEYTAISEQLVMVNELAETATTASETATTKATKAAASADAAAESAEEAATSATNAAASESSVATNAINAASSADAAATSATNAAASEANALESATNAATSATAAATSAEEAATSATNAAESATNAAESASNIATAEENTQTYATNAAASADAAATSATKAQEAYEAMGEEQLVLGETSSTAYRGDRGATAYSTSQSNKASIDAILAAKGVANGYAELNDNGKVPSTQLPSYVDDVIEGYLSDGVFYEDSEYTTEITGETGKIYVDLISELTYRWTGSIYTEISQSLALGESSTTAYPGNLGAKNAENIAINAAAIAANAESIAANAENIATNTIAIEEINADLSELSDTVNSDVDALATLKTELRRKIIKSITSTSTVTIDLSSYREITFLFRIGAVAINCVTLPADAIASLTGLLIPLGRWTPVVGNGKTLGLTTGSDIGYPFTQTYGGTYPIETISGTPPTAGTSMSDTHNSWSYRKTLGLSKNASYSGVRADGYNNQGTKVVYNGSNSFTLTLTEGGQIDIIA